MTNFEKYKDKILYKKTVQGRPLECILCETRNSRCKEYESCKECIVDSFRFIAEEYKPKIKLKQWEYDLIKATQNTYDFHTTCLSKSIILKEFKNMGHFKDIDFSLTFDEVLERAEVKDDE